MKKKMVKRGLKLDNKVFITIILLVTIVFGYVLVDTVILKDSINLDIPTIDEGPQVEVYELSLIMAGDNLIHNGVYNDAKRNANNDGYDFKPMYSYLKKIVKDYDLAYYNQETILGGSKIGLSSYPCFNSPYEVGDAMVDAGFNLVSLATNHTLDRGEKAIKNSCKYWKKQDGVMTAGSYCSKEDRNKVQVMEKNNITYSLLSYTYGTNGIPVPKGKEYLVNVWPAVGGSPKTNKEYQAYKEVVKKDIERVRDKVDVLMVAMHWGVEYTHTPTLYQKDMAKFLAKNGVDIIIGSHPHVVMPVTWIDDTLVIYSLGNLISAQETDLDYAKMVGLLSSVKITKTVIDGESSIKLSELNNELIFTYYNNFRNYKVVPFSNSNIGKYLGDYKRLYKKYSAVIKNMDKSVPVVALSK